ncbi:MAG: hypothetical protein J6V74_07050 [Bacteroidales bacterium]|nr:hypothetical protein [Bacteroidales bacterium]
MSSIEDARLKYRPKEIKLLLIGEAPPKNKDCFFYYENVKKYDFLFLAVLKALGSTKDKEEYIQKKRKEKEKWLTSIQEQGIYLVDISKKHLKQKLSAEQREAFIRETNMLITRNTPIVLIKKNVYQNVYKCLIENHYTVLNKEYIPFPSNSHQREFHDLFLKTLKSNNLHFKIVKD